MQVHCAYCSCKQWHTGARRGIVTCPDRDALRCFGDTSTLRASRGLPGSPRHRKLFPFDLCPGSEGPLNELPISPLLRPCQRDCQLRCVGRSVRAPPSFSHLTPNHACVLHQVLANSDTPPIHSFLCGKRTMTLSLQAGGGFKLSNGVTIPVLGMGLSHNEGGMDSQACSFGISQGVRLFDTAKRYGTESEMCQVWQSSGVSREANALFTPTPTNSLCTTN